MSPEIKKGPTPAHALIMGSMAGYERPNIRRLEGYTPGEQPRTQAQLVKLNTNENPYPPPRAVLEAIGSVGSGRGDELRRYPPPLASPLRQAAATLHGLESDRVIASNGGDELLHLAITVFCEPRTPASQIGSHQPPGPAPKSTGGSNPADTRVSPPADQSAVLGTGGLGLTWPSYSLYPILAAIHDTPITSIPREDDFAVPADFADRLNEAGCRLAFIVNPHAPSGRFESIARLRQIAERFAGVLLIDEAYINFAQADALSLVRGQSGLANVLILRTLSKGYSLAGLRCGYGLGDPALIAALDKARDSYNLNIVTQKAGAAALAHHEEAAETWQAVIDERQRLTDALSARRFTIQPSQSNFILATPPSPGPSAKAIYQALAREHIYVRYFDQPRLDNKLRITIGRPDQSDVLVTALDRIMESG